MEPLVDSVLTTKWIDWPTMVQPKMTILLRPLCYAVRVYTDTDSSHHPNHNAFHLHRLKA
jgi:hypothetical protein